MRTVVSILMSVLKDHTGAHPIRGVSIRKARTVAAAWLVGETMVIILVLTLTNVFKDVTIARPTHTASIRRDHIDVTATGVTINLEVAVMVCVSPLRKLRTIIDIVQKPKCNNCFVIHSNIFEFRTTLPPQRRSSNHLLVSRHCFRISKDLLGNAQNVDDIH